MSNSKSLPASRIHIGIAILLVAIMAMLLFRTEDKLQISLLLLVVSLAVIRPLPYRQWTLVDINLSLVTVYDIVSCLYANCLAPSIQAALLSLLCLTAYFVLRKLLTSENTIHITQLGSYLPIGAALLLAVSSFFIFRQSVLSVGFPDTYHFRFLFRPLGYITNVWAEVLLILLGWVCLIRRFSSLFIFLTILAIIVSFSRGTYIALGVYIITWLFLVKPKREKLRLLAISAIAILLTGSFFPDEMKTTLQMNRTSSQQQSTEGRITAAQAGWDAFLKHPLLGYGNGNYTFAVDQALNQDNTLPYTSYAPNIIIQLLVEKGVIGLFLYLLLALAVFRTIWKRRKLSESIIIGCLLLALVVKEMTQATLLYTPFCLFMLYALFAFLQKKDTSIDKRDSPPTTLGYAIPAVAAVCYFGWLIFSFLQIQNESYQQKSVAAWENGQYAEAILLMEQTGNQTPNLINRGLLYMQYYKKTTDQKYLQMAEQTLQKAQQQQPEDVQIRYLQAQLHISYKNYSKAHQIANELATDFPKNSLYLSILSDILYQQGEKEEALPIWVKAIRYTPRLLTSQRIKDLQQNDPAFYHSLYQRISSLRPTIEDSPTDYARYGYIARWCGNNSAAEGYLQKAVESLPNLATPWHLLGDENKYRLLIYGAFRKDLLSSELPEEKEISDDLLFKTTYQAKFMNWYGSILIP